MSSYVNFFIKVNDSVPMVHLTDFSRSHVIYDIASTTGAPYGATKQVTAELARTMTELARERLTSYEHSLAEYNEQKVLIAQFNNSVEEKLQAISEYAEIIEELKEYIDETRYAEDFFMTLEMIIDDLRWTSTPTHQGVYFGIEVPE